MGIKRLSAVFHNSEIRQKVLYTLAILLIFRIGVHISVPGVDIESIRLATVGPNAGIFEVMNLLGGNALSNYSIFGLGVGPYITASIIIQLLAMDIIPYLADLQNSGEAGRKKLSNITRVIAIFLAFAQAYMLTIAFNTQYASVYNPTFLGFAKISLIMTAGAMFILWLADQITTKGIGNGTSMIIFAGIVDRVPVSFWNIIRGFYNNANMASWLATLLSIGIFVLFIVLIVFTVYTQQATRKIPVQYASSTSRSSENSYLPFKINVSGVIPVIFASAIIMAPATIIQFLAPNTTTGVVGFLRQLFDYSTIPGLILYLVLIFAFTYFYAHLQVDGKKLSENLARSGGYIIGVRPGEETRLFVRKTINRLNFLGAASLAIIAAIPIILPMVSGMDRGLAMGLGGTGLIIAVGVALDIVNKIDSMNTTQRRKDFIK